MRQDETPLPPLIAHRYRVLRALGRGGLASALLVRDEALNVERCLKLVEDASADASHRLALKREFQLLAGLAHPSLAAVHDFGVAALREGSAFFFTADFVRGLPLERWCAGKTFAEVRAALIGPLSALAFLHRAGIRHGDVKPENILVDEGRGVLIDLSCAARIPRAGEARERSREVSGTMGFIAPEVLAGEAGDARADLYAFGKVIDAVAEVIADRLPDAVAALARRLTEERAERRPSEAGEALEALGASANELHTAAREASATVGRDAEIARGTAAIEALVRGEEGPRVVVVRGARGSGRSRVLRELKWRAELACATVEGFRRAGEGAIAAMLGRAIGSDRAEAWAAIEALEAIAARGAPMVLVVDDADRLAAGDRAALIEVAGRLRADGPVLLLASEGPEERGIEGEIAIAIEIGPLDEDAVRAWAADLGVGEAASAIMRLSGGHAADVADVAAQVLAGEAAVAAGIAARRTQLAAAEAAAEAARTADEVVAAAEALQAAGASARALAVLARIDVDAEALAPQEAASVLLRKASSLLARGEPREALAAVERVIARAPEAAAAAHDVAARALIRLGAHGEARARAEAALALGPEASQRADLHEAAGVAASYAGDHDAARVHLATSVALHGDLASPRRLVRVLSYQAIDAYRAGDLDAAVAGYRRALDVAERAGLVEQIARASLNFATACHQRGAYAEALAAYERGERIAAALAQEDLLAVFEFDLAKLWADVGAWDRAEHRASRAERASARVGARFFVAAARSVLGDCALARGDSGEAIARFEAARDGFAAEGAAREVVEEDLEIARAHLTAGDVEAARAAIARARGPVLDQASDLVARAAMLEGRAAIAAGDRDAAAKRFEAAREAAERSGSKDLAAEALALAGEDERARGIWAPVEASLPEALRAGFRAHPRRRAVFERPAAMVRAAIAAPSVTPRIVESRPDRVANLERLIALFRKLNSTVETAEVLGMALDAAIDLTGAERGFVIIDDPGTGSRSVPVSRNVDREKVGKSHLKYSRAIAEQAITTGEPVITVDASADDRFRERQSVHAMRLRSVIAVPIRSPDGVLGALYLDNRFSQARFGRDDADLLLAFSDQVALALRNARIIDDLRRRTRELEEERRRVEELLRGQAERIDRLAEEVRVRQEALEHRHDYRSIIGRGPAMTKLFHTLDRVIDSPLPVLVLGESGTGKELVARAIHFQSARRAGPFVGVNCAALPATLLESELFGHVKGAFTGADRDRTGLVALARGGTLFLDELGEMPLEVQAKLLRVVQEREVRPVGATTSAPVDFRLVCATNRDLRGEVARGRFREDLYYRVGVVEVALPPLRDRTEDLPQLAHHFVTRAAENLGRPAPRLTAAALRALAQHRWPGNVRELENVLTKAVVFAPGDGASATIGPDEIDLPRAAAAPAGRKATEQDERARILAALERTGWNAVSAARELGMPRATFYRRLDRHGIRRP